MGVFCSKIFVTVLLFLRGIRTIPKFRLLTKIDFNVMHLINLSKKIWQKLQIRGSRGLQNSAISDTLFNFWQYYAVKMPLIDFGRLNLPIKAKFCKKCHVRIPCSCIAKIEARQIHELWRSLELRICNFLKNYLTTSTICTSERTAFVVFLEKYKLQIPLLHNLM